MKRLWIYGTSTPIQRIGVIVLGVGLLSLFSWMIKEDLSFEDLFNSYYLPGKRDSIFFHLFFYLIPLGFLMSWGYQVLIKLKEWIFNDKPKEVEQKREPKQKQPYAPHQKNLHFKNNLAAFQFATKNYAANMEPGKINLGLVQDVFQTQDGNQQFLIQLADVGKTTLVSGFNDKHGDKVTKGNLVYWGFVEPVNDLNALRISGIGHVLATLSPEYDPNQGKWEIKNDLTK